MNSEKKLPSEGKIFVIYGFQRFYVLKSEFVKYFKLSGSGMCSEIHVIKHWMCNAYFSVYDDGGCSLECTQEK